MITRIQSSNKSLSFGAIKPSGLEKVLTKAADFTSVHQRLALGASALAIQPMIDIKNKDVDKDTRKVSAARSAAKAIIGTLTGIIVRAGTIALGAAMLAKRDAAGKIIKEIKPNGKKGSYILDHDKVRKLCGKGFESLDDDAIKRIPSVVGTLAALGVMVFSNFLIDAPLTNAAMDKISDFMEKRQSAKKEENGGAQNA